MADSGSSTGKDEKTSSSNHSAIVGDPELDALLDDALRGFDKPPPVPKAPTRGMQGSGGGLQMPSFGAAGAGANDEMNQVWTEEFIREATAQFETKMRECLQSQGVTPGSNAQKSLADISKVVEAATKAAVGPANESSAGMAAQIADAMKNFTPAPEGGQRDNLSFSDNDLEKLMSSFSLGGNNAGDEGDIENIDEILPFMTNVMQKLLSKDLLYPVLTDIADRYPEWLADNRQKISQEDFDKYNRQYEFMKRICEEYAGEKDTDGPDVKRQRFDRISDLMLKVQCTGPPPKELVGEEGSGIPGIDPTAAAGFGGDQCSIV